MPVTSLKKIPIYIWIPPRYHPQWKVEVVGTDTTDISVICSGNCTNGATDKVGDFQFTIQNPSKTYNNKWIGNEIVNIYIDYATTATTKRFKGYIDKVMYTENTVVLRGRSNASRLMDKNVNKSYTSTEASLIIKDLIDTYMPTLTYSKVSTTTDYLTVSWNNKTLFDCFKEVCHSIGYDFYVDPYDDIHFFPEKTITNATEAAIHDSNILEVGEFGPDISQVRNRIIVYGKSTDGVPILYTAESDSSYALIGKWQEESITDSNITTYEQAQERANNELTRLVDSPTVGNVTAIGLVSLAPGEKLRISDPDNNINPGEYRIMSYKHTFDNGEIMTTEVEIEKISKSIQTVIKDHSDSIINISNIDNPYDMKFSYMFTFDTDNGTPSDTTISDGVLKSTTSAGTWTSESRDIGEQITYVQLKVSSTSLTSHTVSISVNNGVGWEVINRDEKYEVAGTGTTLKVKVEFTAADVEIDTLGVLYTTS